MKSRGRFKRCVRGVVWALLDDPAVPMQHLVPIVLFIRLFVCFYVLSNDASSSSTESQGFSCRC
jgi:hypothetical protein